VKFPGPPPPPPIAVKEENTEFDPELDAAPGEPPPPEPPAPIVTVNDPDSAKDESVK
jgi:hypothetical protein